MTPPTFGFSVGDFVAVTTLIVTIVHALRGISDDIIELKELQDELNHLKSLFDLIGNAISTGGAITVQNAKRMLETCSSGQKVLSEFKSLVDKYAGPPAGLVKYRRRVAWSLWKKEKVEQFRRRLKSYITTLSMIQNGLNRREIRELNDQLERRTDNLSALLHQNTEEVKTRLCTVLGEPWDQKPIYFQDAIGRQYPVPLEVVRNFNDFIFLKFAFRGHPISDFIERRELWLFTPASNTEKWWYLINELDWASLLRPGLRLEMSMNLRRKAASEFAPALDHFDPTPFTILDCCAEASLLPNSLVRFTTPMPPWARLPDNLEFRWLSKPAPYGPVSAKPRHETDEKSNDETNEDSGKDESEEFFPASQYIEASDDEANNAASGNK